MKSSSSTSYGTLRPDPRLPAYLVAGLGAVVLAMVTQRHELVALGAPFIALLAMGLRDRRPLGLRGQVTLRTDRATEGDEINGVIDLNWSGEAEVDVMLAGGRGMEPVDPSPVLGWALPRGSGPATLPFSLNARAWGVHDAGALWVRARRTGSLITTEAKLAPGPTIRVLPTELRLSRLLKPGEPRAIAGMHTARLRGHGSDFAEMRPYRPGDRLRDLSWGTSARLGIPWVRVNHPERTGTVVILLDAMFSDVQRTDALGRAARAAWAVASMHLRAQDRVGLLARGRTTAWLPPRGGRRARLMVLDELLAVGGAAEDPTRRRYRRTRATVPADALVVGVTSLRSQTFVPELLHHRRVGHTTVGLIVDTTDLLPESEDALDEAAKQILLAQLEAERQTLERGGVPTATVTADHGAGAAILALRRKLESLGGTRRVRVAT
ncbi:MAG: DUF58 domain-containing protein [Gemmatimonadetes bacterium]|nr:DUF58 domain-containing protein [Gemmatimonadota bacterium]